MEREADRTRDNILDRIVNEISYGTRHRIRDRNAPRHNLNTEIQYVCNGTILFLILFN